MIRAALNGCNGEITFQGKKVYHTSDFRPLIPFSSLGGKLDKTTFLKNLVANENLQAVEDMLADWILYENGWHVGYPEEGYKSPELFYYLCQIGSSGFHRPNALEYFD